jgi:hypothetical protein
MGRSKIGRAHEEAPTLVIAPAITMAKMGIDTSWTERLFAAFIFIRHFLAWFSPVYFSGSGSFRHTFGESYELSELPFEIPKLPRNAGIPDELISDASIVLASGDDWRDFSTLIRGSDLVSRFAS